MAEEKSSGDLFSSSKLVAGAAVSVFQQKNADNVDKQEVAGAAADLLHAASTYGKLEDKPAGQYLEKAEGYLKEFSAGAEKEKADAPLPAPAPAGGDEQKPAEAVEAPKDPVPAPAAKEGKPEGFGLDDVMKGAEQLVGNQGQGEGEKSAGGSAGGLFKAAQGFFK